MMKQQNETNTLLNLKKSKKPREKKDNSNNVFEFDETNVGIYVRVSTEEQAKEGFSVRAQIEKLSNYASIMGWKIHKIYADDGISGKNITDRPQINELLKDIASKKVNTVLVFKVDRLTRSTKDLIELIEFFNEHYCNFSSLMESIDTKTASGRMFLKIIGIFAEFERENIIERVKVGFERKVREGYSLCTYTPSYGYDREVGEKVQRINPDEAKIVQEIFNAYTSENKSMHRIAIELNLRKIPTKLNSIWTGKTIKLILTNPSYIGKVRYCINDESRYFEADGKHDGIISTDTYEAAQVKLSKIEKKLRTKRPSENNFFAGTVYCGICGRRLATHGTYGKLRDGTKILWGMYRCINKMYSGCNAKDMSHKKLEEAFLKYIDNIQEFDIIDEIDIVESVKKEKNIELIDAYNEKLAKLEKKEKEIMKLYVSATLNFDEYSKMTKLIKDDIYSIKNELSKLEVTEEKESDSICKNDIILNIKENWQYLTNQEKLNFLTDFVKKIVACNEVVEGKVHGNVVIKEVIFYND